MASNERTLDPADPNAFACADVIIDARAHELRRGGRAVPLEPKAFAVLLEFIARPNQLLTRDQLLDAVWGHAYVTPATLNRIIAQLRRALGDDSDDPRWIQTVHGLGYRFIARLQGVEAVATTTRGFAPPVRARLPERAEPLIGRDGDIAALTSLLREHRLITVTGPGGIGKTEATLEVARGVSPDYPDGVWWFECSAQSDGAALARLLTSTFEIRTATDPDDLITRLSGLLHARRTLLIFDNCERIAGALAPVLAGTLARCANLRVMVTSQQRLHCAGESLYALSALELPAGSDWKSEAALARLAQVPAVRLLLTRSRAYASGFALNTENARDVAALCRQLAGLPLALELAAARLRLLSPQQLRRRMETRLLNLAAVDPGRPAHHQNLRALIEWSFGLLSAHEQALLCSLSIFAGSCTHGGATAVGAALGLDDPETLELLGGLLDKSLLAMDRGTNPPRYHLLDSVRLYAQEQLALGGHETCARKAHLAHFAQFADRVYSEILGTQQRLWFDRVKREWQNLHTAFEFAMTQPELADSAIALVGNLCWYFRCNSDYTQSAQWLERALAATQAPTVQRARALIALGCVLHQALVHVRAGACLREGIALADQLHEAQLAGAGRAVLAFELATIGDYADAETCAQAALDIAATADPWLHSMALLSRGEAMALQDRHGEAEVALGAALDCLPPDGDFFQCGYCLINRALQRFYLGNWQGAAKDWLIDIELFFTQYQNWRGAAGCVEGAAYIAATQGHFDQSARFLAAASRVREWTAAPLMPQWRKAERITERKTLVALGADFKRIQQAAAEARDLLAGIAAQPVRTGANRPDGS